jgi:hypothetical protein
MCALLTTPGACWRRSAPTSARAPRAWWRRSSTSTPLHWRGGSLARGHEPAATQAPDNISPRAAPLTEIKLSEAARPAHRMPAAKAASRAAAGRPWSHIASRSAGGPQSQFCGPVKTNKFLILLVGAARFELATPSPPDWEVTREMRGAGCRYTALRSSRLVRARTKSSPRFEPTPSWAQRTGTNTNSSNERAFYRVVGLPNIDRSSLAVPESPMPFVAGRPSGPGSCWSGSVCTKVERHQSCARRINATWTRQNGVGYCAHSKTLRDYSGTGLAGVTICSRSVRLRLGEKPLRCPGNTALRA